MPKFAICSGGSVNTDQTCAEIPLLPSSFLWLSPEWRPKMIIVRGGQGVFLATDIVNSRVLVPGVLLPSRFVLVVPVCKSGAKTLSLISISKQPSRRNKGADNGAFA